MPNPTFAKGIEVYYDGMYCTVDFICEKYITVCINKAESRLKDVCLLVYPNDYDKITLVKESSK
jgi:hypothetical protein